MDHIRSIRRKFDDAGLELNSYNASFKDHFTDEEIARGFETAHALGVPAITSSAHVNSVPRIADMAARYDMPVAMHNHSPVDPNEFSGPEDFDRAIAQGDGRTIAANLDIGHFVAANHDPVRHLAAHHDQIATIHLKDRRRDEGPNTPIGEVLRMVRDGQWDIPTNIEYEYPGDDTVSEVRRCFDFCRNILGARHTTGPKGATDACTRQTCDHRRRRARQVVGPLLGRAARGHTGAGAICDPIRRLCASSSRSF